MKLILYCFVVALIFPSCKGCSDSNRKRTPKTTFVKKTKTDNSSASSVTSSNYRTVIKMKIGEGGVYTIPVTINGTEMHFIFDTGAGLISISSVEATFLYRQGKLSEDDIIGKANFMDANGDISEGTIIMLDEVTIGNRTLNNIEASVVDNLNAPLLFGQSALQKFGKVSIDYKRNEISFE